jgi:3-hydroxyisobutyrate dehydrogenase-like beta-hydroxyacid dehydrogenase
VVGLGGMGGAMAANLLDAGWQVIGYNRTASRAGWLVERGLEAHPTPGEAVAPVTVVSLYDDEALLAVVEGANGLVAGSGPGTVIVETSTVRPKTSARAAEAIAATGGTLLRAPVSGNTTVAEAANLTFLCSGERSAYERCFDLFGVLGRAHHYLGPGEEARYAKLALNLMIGGSMQLLAEALSVAEAAGIERRPMLELIGESAVGSPLVGYKTDPLVAEDYSPTFSVNAMRKDLGMLFEVAAAIEVGLPATGVVDELLAACQGEGWAEADFAVLDRLQRAHGGAAAPRG